MSNAKWNRILYDAYSLETDEEKKRFLDTYEITLAGTIVKIHQSKPKTNNSVGLIVWDGSLVLAKYLERLVVEGNFDIVGKRVIELGAGCGIPGIAASLLGGRVTLTDLPRILDQLQINADENLKGKAQFPYQVKELVWGKTPLSTLDGKFDLILGADVVYYDKAIKGLLKTCWELSHENSLILFAFEMHVEEAAETFWEEVCNYFQVTKIPYNQLDTYYKDKNIEVLKLTRLPNIQKSEKQEDEEVRLHDSESDYSDDWGSDDDSDDE